MMFLSKAILQLLLYTMSLEGCSTDSMLNHVVVLNG